MEINHLYDTALRTCSKCGETKALDDFHMNSAASKDGTTIWRRRRPECTACTKVAHAERFQRRKEVWEPKRHAWYMANYAKTSWMSAKYRAKKAGATEFLSLDEWIDLKRSTTTCHWCAITLHESFTNVDHVRPLVWGGQHTRDNLVLACANCNVKRDWERKTKYERERP
jgi:5-methylcytosine-specific restriction enzyme A